MIKKIYLNSYKIILILAVLFVTVIPPIEVQALDKNTTLGDLKNQLKELQNKKAAQESAKKQTEAEKKANKNKQIKTEAELEETKAQIQALEEQVENTNKEIEKVKKETENVLIYYQQIQTSNILAEYITGASSVTDLVRRVNTLNQLLEANEARIHKLELLIETNAKQNKEIEKLQVKLEEKVVAFQKAWDKLDEESKELELGVLSIDEEIKALKETIDTYEKMGCKLDETINECIRAKEINNSGWLRPVSKGRITSLYGYRTSPTAGASSNHKGIDIGVAEGTKVYATAAGVVEKIVRESSCGGNMVYISTTVKGVQYIYVFMHLLKINVKVGDVVTTDMVVATSGGGKSTAKKYGHYDKCTTGAHLHYGLAKTRDVSKFNSYTINPPGYPNLYQWFYTR